MSSSNNIFFAPQLYIKSGITDISFYTKAFGAVEQHRWTNDDGSIHAAELLIGAAIFHLHEDTARYNAFNPHTLNGTTTIIGLFVPDVDAMMNSAVAAGAEVLSAAQSYDYGYRQGEIKDPFGHIWMIEKKL